MIQPPGDISLPINKLSTIFNDTTNSYKFYWFLSILDEITENEVMEIGMETLYKRMISHVWYPLDYFKLSFGKQDGFKKISEFISKNHVIDNSLNAPSFISQIDSAFDKYEREALNSLMNDLVRWVPYRFIRPFFAEETRGLYDTKVNGVIKVLAFEASRNDQVKTIYYFSNNGIVINKVWKDYLIKNHGILRAFTYWHLIRFLQKNNPNVIGISEKLFKPSVRNLKRKIDCWKTYIQINRGITCMYTGQQISTAFSLDHFIPWSYTVHDLNWNLAPINPIANSSKSDILPSVKYLVPFAQLQCDFIKTMIENDRFLDILEDYCLLFNTSINGIKDLNDQAFTRKITETIKPMMQIAANMGFKSNWYYGNK